MATQELGRSAPSVRSPPSASTLTTWVSIVMRPPLVVASSRVDQEVQEDLAEMRRRHPDLRPGVLGVEVEDALGADEGTRATA